MNRRGFLKMLGFAPAVAVGTVAAREISETEAMNALSVSSSRVEYVAQPPLAPWLQDLMRDPEAWAREKAAETLALYRRPDGLVGDTMEAQVTGEPFDPRKHYDRPDAGAHAEW